MTTITAYHGTGRNFTEFDKSYIGCHHDFFSDGFFFITDQAEAEWYANDNPNNEEDWTPVIISAEITLDNPLILKAGDDSVSSNPTNFFDRNVDRLYNRAFNNDHDGIIVNGTGEYDGIKFIVAFEPDQINIKEVTTLE